jgi:hypothetical protein
MSQENMNKVVPVNNDIQPTRVVLPSDPFEVMDKMDDQLIIQEIEGRIVNTWVYHFRQNGQEQWGLSKVGVDAACSELAKKGEVIRELEVKYDVDPTSKEHVLFVAKAGRYAVGRDGKEVLLDTAIGTKRQGLKTTKTNGAVIDNSFWFEQGATKALRNARSRLIGEEIRSRIIAFAKKNDRVQVIDAPSSQDQRPDNGPSQRPSQPLEGMASESQKKAIFAISKSKGISEEAIKKDFGFQSMNDLTKQQASDIISSLNKR